MAHRDGVAIVALNRPHKHNALDDAMVTQLLDQFAELSADDATRVIILKGLGPSFCSGADVGAPRTAPHTATEDLWHMLDRRIGRFLEIWDSPKAVIAQVHGHCVGIATALCNFCDMVVVADDAKIAWPKLPLGGGVLGPLSVFSIGVRKAKELSFQTGSELTGLEAAEIGWANRAVPANELDAAVSTMATRIARTPPGLLRLKKQALNRLVDNAGFRDAVQTSALWDAIAHTDPGVREVAQLVREIGMKASIERFGA
jgi:enoyl-CoA hydratase